MLQMFRHWFNKYFSDEEAVVFLVLLFLAFFIIYFFGHVLAPMLTALVLAYLFQGLISKLERSGVTHNIAVTIVFVLFVSLLFGLLFVVAPLAWKQLSQLAAELPKMISEGQMLLLSLPERYPELIPQERVAQLLQNLTEDLGQIGPVALSLSVSTLPNLFQLMIFLVLVPVLVFFLLKDRDYFINSLVSLLPEKRGLLTRIWHEMDDQIANYVRGKALEILIVGVTSYLAFALLDLNYAELLAIIVGLSVLVPYIGATVVTFPVAIIAYFQWGWGSEFLVLMGVYAVIQALDGNVLVPLLFSEVVNLHPVSIILAVLVFGGLWGLWGVFFAIPLATLLKATISAWPAPGEGDIRHLVE